jgi:RimJ/RimL family protein N-acetyltransferase
MAAMEPIEPVELVAGPLRLRPWREDDVEDVWAAQQDPVVRLWAGGVASRADTVALLHRLIKTPDRAAWAVTGAATGALLGSVSLHSIDPVQNDAEIGYWTLPAARGRGVSAAAVDSACRWAFAALPVDRVELLHAVENPASRRVAEKAGFTYEGHLRRSYRYGDGVKHDELLWARLSDDPAPELSTRS